MDFARTILFWSSLIAQCSSLPFAPWIPFFGLRLSLCPLSSCNNRCQVNDEFNQFMLTCQCDDLCIIFGDCCPDYYRLCHSFNNEEEILHFIQRGGKIPEKAKARLQQFLSQASCHPVQFERHNQGMLSVNKCIPSFANGNIKDRCEGKKSAFPFDIPVSVESEPFLTYQNIYCAHCSENPDIKTVTFWKANIKCQVNIEDTIMTFKDLREVNETRCITEVTKPPSVQIRLCHTKITRTSCDGNPTQKDPHEEEEEEEEDEGEIKKHINKREAISNSNNEFDIRGTENQQNSSFVSGLESEDANTNGEGSVFKFPSVNITTHEGEHPSASNPNSTLSDDVKVFIFASETVVKNNIGTLCGAYSSPYGNQIMYNNPHCYACLHGWEEFARMGWHLFDDTDSAFDEFGFPCAFLGGSSAQPFFPSTKTVVFTLGIYNFWFFVYSSELGQPLEGLTEECGQNEFLNPLQETCERFLCHREYFPYYGSCLQNKYTIKPVQQHDVSTQLYVSMEATLLGLETVFITLIENVINNLKSFEFSTLILNEMSPVLNITRKIEIKSIDVIQKGSREIIIPSNHSAPISKSFFTKLHLEIVVPVYFNDLNRTIADLNKSNWSNSRLTIKNMTIKNFNGKTNLTCPKKLYIVTQWNKTIVEGRGRGVFAETEDGLVDISRTRFILRHRDNLTVDSMTYCFQTSAITSGFQRPTKDKPVPSCEHWTILTPEMFTVVEGGLMLKSGQFLKNDEAKEEEFAKRKICTSKILPYKKIETDSNAKFGIKNISSSLALSLKLLSVLVAFCRRHSASSAIFITIVSLSTALIDIIHLVGNFTISPMVLSMSLHFSWLFVIYSLLACCISMPGADANTDTKHRCRYLMTAISIPLATVVICATGDMNDPPWNIGYGSTDNIFSVGTNVLLYGYMTPFCVGMSAITVIYMYRVVRRKVLIKDNVLCLYNMVVTALVTTQFGLACAEHLTNMSLFYYLYFTLSIVMGWTFMTSCTLGMFINASPKLASSKLYVKAHDIKSIENVCETTESTEES